MSYIAMMPLVKNVPEPGHAGWERAVCPKCGRPCWYMVPQAEQVKRILPSARFLCTECALRSRSGREPGNES